MSAAERHGSSHRLWRPNQLKQSHTVEKAHERSTRAQQQENSKLSLSLSLLDVGPCNVVPFIDSTTVELSRERNTKPRNPFSSSSQPKGKLYEALRGGCKVADA